MVWEKTGSSRASWVPEEVIVYDPSGGNIFPRELRFLESDFYPFSAHFAPCSLSFKYWADEGVVLVTQL